MSQWIAAIIQGITETMPISSSLHLALYNCSQDTIASLHFYSGIAGALTYGRYIDRATIRALALVTILQIPSYFIVKLLTPSSLYVLPISIAASGILLYCFDISHRNRSHIVSVKHALIFGCIQSFGALPGFSRLGAGLIAANMLHLQDPWRFAVLLGVPLNIGVGLAHGITMRVDGLLCLIVSILCYRISAKISLTTYAIYKLGLAGLLLYKIWVNT